MRPAAWHRTRPRPLGSLARRAWRARAGATLSQAERFVSGIARRHGRAPGRHHRAAGIVLRRAVGAGAARRITVRAVVRLAQRVVLGRVAAASAADSRPPTLRPARSGERIARRLASQGARPDSVAPARATRPPLTLAAASALPALPVPPVARVVCRPSTAADAAPGANWGAPVRAARADLIRQGAPAVPVGDAELGRLADRVVEAIDRRLVAQRERMGRR